MEMRAMLEDEQNENQHFAEDLLEPRDVSRARPRGLPLSHSYSLNSRKLTAPMLRQVASALELPVQGSLDDVRLLIEGKLLEIEREPRNVQVVAEQRAEGQTIQLVDAEGVFLETQLVDSDAPSTTEEIEKEPSEETTSGEEETTSEEGDLEAAREALTTELADTTVVLTRQVEELTVAKDTLTGQVMELTRRVDELSETNGALANQVEELTRQVEELTVSLSDSKVRVRELWSANCAQLHEFEQEILGKDNEIAALRLTVHSLATSGRGPVGSTSRDPVGSRLHSGPVGSTSRDSEGSRTHSSTDPGGSTHTHSSVGPEGYTVRESSRRTHSSTEAGGPERVTSGLLHEHGTRHADDRATTHPPVRTTTTPPGSHPVIESPGRSSDRSSIPEGPLIELELAGGDSSSSARSGVTNNPVRKGHAPPLEPFTGDDDALLFDDWLPRFKDRGKWYRWTESEELLQLGGYLRGKARQEWELLDSTERANIASAIQALGARLDPGSKSIAAQDFRYSFQEDREDVSTYKRRLEKAYVVAYGKDRLSTETRAALLYGQMHARLRYDIMQAPAVSGSDSYATLCLAAKSEERRLLELKKRQQYARKEQVHKGTSHNPHTSYKGSMHTGYKGGSHTGYKGSHHSPSKQMSPTQSSSKPSVSSPNKREGITCFTCGKTGHFQSNCPQKRTESEGKFERSKPQEKGSKATQRQVQSETVSQPKLAQGSPSSTDPLDLLLSDSEESDGSVNRVEVKDRGSSTRGVQVSVQGVPAVGVVDSGADITIMGPELFKKVATTARLKKRELKKPDEVPRTYDQRVISLDGRLDLEIEFGEKCLKTPVYLKMDAQDQLLLSEGVCRQLDILSYHTDVKPIKELLQPTPRNKRCSEETRIPMIRVSLVQSVQLLPHQSVRATVKVSGPEEVKEPLLLEDSSNILAEFFGIHCDAALIEPSEDGLARVVLSNSSGVSVEVSANTVVGEATTVSVVEPCDDNPDEHPMARMCSVTTVQSDEIRKKKLSELVKCSDVLDTEQAEELMTFLAQYHEAFCLEPGERGETDLTEMEIHTGDASPRRVPARRMPLAVRQEVARQLQSMQEAGVIKPSNSPWSSPIVMVRKKDGTHRFCVDYRALNAVTKQDTFPLPRVDDLIDQMGESRFFSTLDLASGYWQIRMSPKSREKTAFVVPQGLYEFRVMPFGLTNAPAVFQRLMQRVLQGLNPPKGPDFVSVYIDHVLVCSSTLEEHLKHLRLVIQRIKEVGLKLNPSKCRFVQKEVEYLGHLLTTDGLKPNPKTVLAVKEFPTPTNLKEVRQFLGLSSYYRRFIHSFAKVAQPLNNLTRKGVHFHWTQECQQAFETLKEKLIAAPVLSYPCLKSPFRLETDASILGIGAILSQEDESGVTHPVAYASRSLNAAERNYSITELETLAVVWAMGHFRPYLYGNSVTVFTDHSAVKAILNTPNPSGKHARWWTKVYGSGVTEVNIVYQPGKSNANADALLRSPQLPAPLTGIAEAECQVAAVTTPEKTMQEISEILALQPDTSIGEQVPFPEEQRKDVFLNALIQFVEENTLPADDQLARRVALQAPLFTVSREVLYYVEPKPSSRSRVAVPSHLREQLMEEAHRSIMSGHFSGPRTYDNLARIWWWPSLYSDVQKYVQSCPECLVVKGDGHHNKPPLHPISVSRPFQIVGVDVMDLPVTASGNRHVVVFQDYLTKWPLVFPLPDQKTHRLVDLLVKEAVPQFGVPECLLSDRGTNLLSHLMKDTCKALGIKKLNTTAYHPQTDGMVERFNRTLKSMIRKHAARFTKQWDKHLYGVLWAYRNTVHESTGEKPSFLMYGVDLRSPSEAELLDRSDDSPVEIDDYREQVMSTLGGVRACYCYRVHKTSSEEVQGTV